MEADGVQARPSQSQHAERDSVPPYQEECMQVDFRSLVRFALCALVLGACDDDDFDETVEVASSSTADFTQYETFAFADRSSDVLPSGVAVNLDSVSDAMRDQLEDLGLEEVDLDDDPDLVAFNLTS